MLTKPGIFMVTNLRLVYVSSEYLGDFSYITYEEFYSYFCNLNITPGSYEGTTRQKFLSILKNAYESAQSKILKAILKNIPLTFYPKILCH